MDGINAENHRPFIPEKVWKIFSAYQGLLLICQMRLQALSTGIRETEKLFATSKMIDEIKEVMPHFKDYLDQYGMAGAAQLADPLRNLLLNAIRASLQDSEDEQNATQRVAELIQDFERDHPLVEN